MHFDFLFSFVLSYIPLAYFLRCITFSGAGFLYKKNIWHERSRVHIVFGFGFPFISFVYYYFLLLQTMGPFSVLLLDGEGRGRRKNLQRSVFGC